MTSFYIPSTFLETWIHQNDAEYLGDYVPGCLLDNFTMGTRRGYAAIYEHYLNEWTSDYYIEFQPYGDQYAEYDVIDEFYKFMERSGYDPDTDTFEFDRG